MATVIPIRRELAHRESNGIEVTLYWSKPTNRVSVVVFDAQFDEGFEFEVEMLTLAIREDLPIAWVPVRTIYAGSPSHIRPVDHLQHFVRIVRHARRDVRRADQSAKTFE